MSIDRVRSPAARPAEGPLVETGVIIGVVLSAPRIAPTVDGRLTQIH